MVPPKTCREKRKHAIVVHLRRNRWAHGGSEASIGEGRLLRTGGIRHVSPQESSVVSARRPLVKGLRKAGWKARECEILCASRYFPLLFQTQTLLDAVGISHLCQSTKSLRSSPLRGSKSREAGSRLRGQRWRV